MSDSAKNILPGNFVFVTDDNLQYFLPEICAVSELQTVPSDFTDSGCCAVFTVYLTYGNQVEFAFETEKEGRVIRKELINTISNYWGPDKLVYANGFEYEVAVIPAILDITDIFNKGRNFMFSVSVNSVSYPINMIFDNEPDAIKHHKSLTGAVELYRQDLLGSSSIKVA